MRAQARIVEPHNHLCKNGAYLTAEADADSSIIEFQQLLASSTGVQPWEQEVKCGFPPRPLGMPDDRSGTTVRCLGLQSGDSLTVNRVAVAERPVGDTDARFPAADTGSFTVAGMVSWHNNHVFTWN